MKKLISIAICFVMLIGLCACGGDVGSVEVPRVESEIYTDADITAAIDVIIEEFDREWNGCTLTRIAYAGDERNEMEQAYYGERYPDCRVLVLTSSFDVDASGGDGSLNPDSTYEGWSWILVRKNGGQWNHVDHGYG